MKKLGKEGEEKALEYLEKKGYLLLEKNYRSTYGEIDIIVHKDNCLVFVEVKTRKAPSYLPPSDSVHPSKQKKIAKTALLYLQEKEWPGDIRFDVIEVLYASGGIFLPCEHLEDAFSIRDVIPDWI